MPRPLPRAAAIAWLAIASATGTAWAQPKPADPAAIEEARKHMKAGAAFYEDAPEGHKCEEALAEFTKAYELSGSLRALKGMAICNLFLERDADAIDQYTTYLAGKDPTLKPEERKLLEGDLNRLKAAVATLRLSANVPGVRVRDERTPSTGSPVRNTYTLADGERPLGIHPGQHVFTASAEGFPDQVWRVEIANGGAYTHVFTFEKEAGPVVTPAPQPPATMVRPVPTAVWAMVGVTGALGIAWGALAIRAKLLNGAYADANGKKPVAELESMRKGVTTANVVADVFLGTAVASLGVTAALYFTRPSVQKPSGVASLHIVPAASLSGGGAVLGGSF